MSKEDNIYAKIYEVNCSTDNATTWCYELSQIHTTYKGYTNLLEFLMENKEGYYFWLQKTEEKYG